MTGTSKHRLATHSTPGGFGIHGNGGRVYSRIVGRAVHEASEHTLAERDAQWRMRPCPECGHVYKKPGLADAEGRCLNGKACARHRTLGY